MLDTASITFLTSLGACGVFCLLFVMGVIYPRHVVDDLKAERDYERQRAEAERDRAETAVAAAQASRDVLAAIQTGAALGYQRRELPERGPS